MCPSNYPLIAPAPSEPTSSVAAPDKEADEDGDEEPGMRVLSKKEKEKLKKEKEKVWAICILLHPPLLCH
jgi:translation initiation factor 5B